MIGSKKKQKRSLKGTFFRFSVIMILVIFVELGYVFVTSTSLFDRYQAMSSQSMLQMYSQSIDNRLRIVNSYMDTQLTSGSDVRMLGSTTDARTRFTVRKNVSAMLSNLLQLEPMASGALCWEGEEIVSVSSTNSMLLNNDIRNGILSMASENEPTLVNTGWNWVPIQQRWYLINIRRYQSCYMGVWMDESIAAEGFRDGEIDGNYLLCCKQGDNMIALDESQNVPDMVAAFDAQPSQEGSFSYCCLTLNVGGQAYGLLITILICCVLIVGTVFFCNFWMHHAVSITLGEVQSGLVRKGNDITCRLADTGQMMESDNVFKALDDMSDRIADLQKNVYLHEINEQKSRLQALHMQINSHFFGNCINIIFSLAQIGRMQLIQDFSIYLIDYLHYINTAFKTSSVLSDELLHLQNYLSIQQMRYPDRIVWKMDVMPEAKNARILPLILLTLIENIFKHALPTEAVCHILVRIKLETRNDQSGMVIHIEDDGQGIDDQLAASLNTFDFNLNPDFENKSGIQKTLARIQLHYGNRASFHIGRGADDKGTVIDLYLP